jgi:hypothetical protein
LEGTLRPVSQDLIDKLNIKVAVQQEVVAKRNLLPPEPWQAVVLANADAFAEWVTLRLKVGARNGSAIVVNARKPRWGFRPVPVVGLAERVAYRAIATHLLSDVPAPARSASDYASFVSGPIGYALPNGGFLKDAEFKYVVESDIVAFYQYIDHEILQQELYLQTAKVYESQVMVELLGEIQGSNFGLPQLLDPSDELSEMYARILQRDVVRMGLPTWRYNDDFRISAIDYGSAQRAVETLGASAHEIGLVLNENKTKILKLTTYAWQNMGLEADHDEAQVDPTQIPLAPSDYPDLDDQEILDGAREIMAQVGLVSGPGRINLKDLSRNDQRKIRRALTALTSFADSYAVHVVPDIVEFAPELTPRACEYLVALQGDHRSEVIVAWDDIMSTRGTVLNEWQKVWLVYVGRQANVVESGDTHRVELVKELLRHGRNGVLHAEAALCLSTVDQISFDELDIALRTEPEPLAYWYALAVRELKKTASDELVRQIDALSASSPMYQVLIDG